MSGLSFINKRSTCGLLAGLVVWCVVGTAVADTVYRARKGRKPARLKGTVTQMTMTELKIKTDRGEQLVPASEIVRVVLESQPSAITRARERFEDGRFTDCLESLDQLEDDVTGQPFAAEADFLRAAARANIAIAGGDITAQTAGQEVNAFLKKHSGSYLNVPATELFGKLLFAFGKLDAAAQAFDQLTQSGWPIYQVKGPYLQGLAQLEQQNLAAATRNFELAASSSVDNEDAQKWQQLAQIQQLRCQGLAGESQAAIEQLKSIVQQTNPDNADVFATASNALGSIYQKNGQTSEARIEYLKTELLFPTATDAHAEALFRLSQIWAQLNESDRASRARETLKARYRNSYWASRL